MKLFGFEVSRVRSARKARFFAGAANSRFTEDWWAKALSADGQMRGSLKALRQRARQLHRDTPFAQRLAQLYRTHVIGPVGITLQSRLMAGARLDTPANDAIEMAWWTWGRDASVAGDTWCDVQDQYAIGMAIDGEFLARRVLTPDGPRLQILDPDQLDEAHNVDLPDGARISMGVEQDRYGRPIAYHISDGHPERARVQRVRVPASEVVHIFRRLRPGQSRGVPPLAPVMLALKMLDGYQEAELIAARMGAAKSVYFTQDPESGGSEAADDVHSSFEPGQQTILPPGMNVVSVDPNHPNAGFDVFMKAVLRSVANGCGVAYTSLSGDLTAVNYSSIRAGLLDERDEWKALHRFTIEHLCAPVFAWWCQQAGLRGQLVTSLALRAPMAAQWQPRGWAWVDPLNDIQTLEREIALGINSRSAAAAERGRDFADLVPQIKAETDLAASANVFVGGLDYAPAENFPATEQPTRALRVVRSAANG